MPMQINSLTAGGAGRSHKSVHDDPGSATRPSLLVTLVATALGAGFSPYAPGTCGTLAAVPLAYGLLGLGRGWFAAGTVLVTLGGIWAAGRFCQATGCHDNQRVVIDEVAGYLLSVALVPRSAVNLLAAFGLFRLLDIWKPWPIRVLDRRVGGGLGVMADDLAAGALAAGILFLLQGPLMHMQALALSLARTGR